MERSVIRGRSVSFNAAPGFHFVLSGLRRIKERKRNAVRRCSVTSAALRAAVLPPPSPPPACGGGHRRGAARLPAFHRGSCQRDSCIPTAQLRARLRGASAEKWRGYPARRRPRSRDTWFRLNCIVVRRKDQTKMVKSLREKILTDPH